mgnify:CR=1 FL=1
MQNPRASSTAYTNWGSKEFDEEPNLNGHGLRLRLKGLKAPVKQVQALVGAISAVIDLKEICFAPWCTLAGSLENLSPIKPRIMVFPEPEYEHHEFAKD